MATLCSGATRANTPDTFDPICELVDGELIGFLSGGHLACYAQLGGALGGGVVAGDHLRLDPGAPASFDRQPGFGAGWVRQTHEPFETQLLDVGAGVCLRGQSEWAMRRDASARTRKPRSPSASFVVRTMLRPAGSSGAHVQSPAAVLAQWVSSTSGAPLM